MDGRRLATAVAFLTLVGGSLAARVFQVPFTSDLKEFDPGLYGPDGPWHAAVITLGYYQKSSIYASFDEGYKAPVWPTGSTIVQLLTTEGGGPYNRSSNATAPWIEFGSNGNNDMREADWFANQYSEGVGITDSLSFINLRLDPGYANVNATIYAMNTSRIMLPDGRSYKPMVGNLGLGRPVDTEFAGHSMLEQMKTAGIIGSNSFGLHLGSPSLRQRGSLFLGGYEENRAIGQVGAFAMQYGFPIIFLLDVTLGVELGPWPFNTTGPIGSVWPDAVEQGDGRTAANFFGGRENSVLINPNPAVPGIYLPSPTCANAAKHLPVRLDEKLGYYLWDTEDPIYWSTINSATYLGFTMADSEAVNLTIKVPLKMLNLTLEAPIVETPVSYFPCHDVTANGTGAWELGRAFLQSAFLGVNFETNLTFLAQAPGPNLEQSIVRAMKPEDKTLVTKPITAFVDTWRASWLALDSEPPTARIATRLSAGQIAGIVVGVVVGISVITLGCLAWRRRKLRVKGPVELHTGGRHRVKKEGEKATELGEHGSEAHEMGYNPIVELDSPAARAELGSPVKAEELDLAQLNEAPGSPGVYEMSADRIPSGDTKREVQTG